MDIDYSVVIRTTGNAGVKYQKLLESISRLEPSPKEIIVVLPEGYDLPKEQLGWESFYFCPKGMVRQRLEGIKYCKTKYALVCDDDITFEKDFVRKLYHPLYMGKACFSAGPLYSFLPSGKKSVLFAAITGSAVPALRRNRYISVFKGTGYSYNKHLRKKSVIETQSIPWTCFFAEVTAFRKLRLEDEKWLDMNGYSAMDDQSMFYKAWLMGLKTVIVESAKYNHLDAKTSTRNNKPAFLYSFTFNRTVFWHRFIYMQDRAIFIKAIDVICFQYRMFWIKFVNKMAVLRGKMDRDDYQILMRGYHEGLKYVHSEDYKRLPVINK